MNDFKRNGFGYADPTSYNAMKNYMGTNEMVVRRGDIYFVKKNSFTAGSEQEAGRPAIIVSNDTGNRHSQVVEVVYLTTQTKNPLPTHVDVVCRTKSIALCEQVHSVYKDRLFDFVKTCSDAEMAAIDKALMISLGLDLPAVTDDPAVVNIKNQEIDNLKKKLEVTLRELDELKEQPIFPSDSDEVLKLKAQIEMLEKQNERLLDRLIG